MVSALQAHFMKPKQKGSEQKEENEKHRRIYKASMNCLSKNCDGGNNSISLPLLASPPLAGNSDMSTPNSLTTGSCPMASYGALRSHTTPPVLRSMYIRFSGPVDRQKLTTSPAFRFFSFTNRFHPFVST